MVDKNGMWHRLRDMAIGPADAALGFDQRLARENSWSAAYARRVILEYKRFIFLAATAPDGRPVTPSDAVDQAWHLHLTYSRDYWEVMCREILQKPLHHGPTAGGAQEDARYHGQYQDTLLRYEQSFGESPPIDIWPHVADRFSGDWGRVDRQRYFIVPRSRIAALSVLPATMLLAACTFSGTSIAVSIAIFAGAGLALYLAMKAHARSSTKRKNKDGGCGAGVGMGCSTSSSNSSNAGDSSSGCGGGGCGGGGCGS